MSFCKNCGAGINDGDRFCVRCGAPTEAADKKSEEPTEQAEPTDRAERTEPQPQKPFDKKIIAVAVLIALLLIGVTVGGILVMSNIRHKQAHRHKTVDVNA
ncbi:MAG: zinc-ribbon domain-containing protein, partial [Butyrivibrio sp.]|nr:zinc-ribbon domain-containing protein [Butyrivibrio sp.]